MHSTQEAGLHSDLPKNKVKVSPSPAAAPAPGTSAWQIAHCISLSFISGSFLFSYQHHTFSDLTTLPTPLRACRKSTVHCFTSSPSRLSGLLFLPHRLLPRSPLPPANPYSHFLDLVLFDLSAASVTGDLLLFFSSN